jgi:hypothetical protein
MIEDYENQRRKQIALRRSITDYVMGVLFLLLGLGLLLHNTIGFDFGPDQSPAFNTIFSIWCYVCVVYGGWRIYRGYKKDYFK